MSNPKFFKPSQGNSFQSNEWSFQQKEALVGKQIENIFIGKVDLIQVLQFAFYIYPCKKLVCFGARIIKCINLLGVCVGDI